MHASGYRGADRRVATAAVDASWPPRVKVVGTVTAAVVVATVTGYGLSQIASPIALAAGLSTLVGMSLCVLGGLLVVGWRLGGRRRAAFVGLAVTAIGLAHIPFLALFGPQSTPRVPIGVDVAQFIVAGLGVVLLLGGLLGPEVDSTFGPGRLVARFAATLVVASLAGVMADAVAGNDMHSAYTSHLLTFATGAAWIATGAALVVLGVERRRSLLAQTGLALIVLGAGWAVSAVDDSSWLATGATITVVGLALFIRTFHPEVDSAFETRGRADSVARARWQAAEAALKEQERQRAEVHHELRNALTGIEGAVLTLQRHRDALAESTAAELSGAISTELQRAQQLLAPRTAAGQTFDVRAALHPLAVTEWAAGHPVSIETDESVLAHGDPHVVAEVVRNLLRNCSVHAPGATVRLLVRSATDTSEIVVEDDGPGFAAGCADRVFDRGWCRDSATAGEGLGLFLCRRLVLAQGGTIRVENAERGGARVVVTLPAGLPGSGESGAPAVVFPHQRDGSSLQRASLNGMAS